MRLQIPRQTFMMQIKSFRYSERVKTLRVSFKSYDIGDHQSSYLISSVLIKLAESKRIEFRSVCADTCMILLLRFDCSDLVLMHV